ncbi:hypothetical protein MUN79_22400 [Hymenobacter cellulosilyticus]|uniref:Peptidase M61 N-terminal domain-containing protein n=1 Tax=Hymenobacter cellulosilyticus TaxID=2932248 RepID=A0A8T9Q6E3_9BACT|nr:hypothetical protein [Hymenobacter cellulosilyticus]UOQ71350.1 hypothetical protein MUN79_22400 [Hymenobacter cellulosilyticus]
MKPYLALLPLLLAAACKTTKTPVAAGQNTYRYSVDLRRPDHDRLRVEVQVPRTRQRQAVFVIPKIVPGIYGAMNFGRYVTSFTALGPDNQPCP